MDKILNLNNNITNIQYKFDHYLSKLSEINIWKGHCLGLKSLWGVIVKSESPEAYL